MPDLTELWSTPLAAAVCEACETRYLLSPKCLPAECPYCVRSSLIPLSEQGEESICPQPAELVLPFMVSEKALAQSLQSFASGIWFAPADLKAETLINRLRRVYLSKWLVDSRVEALWQAEAGFNYQVVSHQDRYDENQGGWVSREVTETRIRWEPRLGRLNRTYHNIPAPALEQEAYLKERLGPYDLAGAQPYRPSLLGQALVHLPDRPPDDAWSDTLPSFQASAAEECRQASQADHLRDFRWSPAYQSSRWTLLLQPVLTTYYTDDEGRPQIILIHGQSGRLNGNRRASLKRAKQISFMIGGLALLLFFCSLLLMGAAMFLPRLSILAAASLFGAILLGLAALVPLLIAWHFNRMLKDQGGLDRPAHSSRKQSRTSVPHM